MKSSMSGWSVSRMTILAARRVLPPDLIVPADASAPRMKLTGPDAVPPPLRSSSDERIRDRFTPAPDPPLKMVPSSVYQLRMESMESSTERMKQLWTRRFEVRYSPLSVWMSYTSISPSSWIVSIVSRLVEPYDSPGCQLSWSPGRKSPASTKSPADSELGRQTRWSLVTSSVWPDSVRNRITGFRPLLLTAITLVTPCASSTLVPTAPSSTSCPIETRPSGVFTRAW